MADTIDVEATPIEQELDTISRGERWLAGAAERVALRCEEYRPPKRIESERERKECVSARTQVRKDAAEIDAERKALLRTMEDALRKFKSDVKDVLSPLTDLDEEYKRLLDEYEEGWKANRVIELTEEYEALAPDIAIPIGGNSAALVPFERLMARFGSERGKVWTNRSTNIQAAKAMIGESIYVIADAERTIRETVPEEDVDGTLLSYFASLDLQQALSGARKLREQREQLAQLEAERAAREAEWANPQPPVEPLPNPQPMVQPAPAPAATVDVPHAWVIIASSATKAQMLQLRDYARSVGIPFDCIYSGTLQEVYGRVTNA